MSEFRTGYRFWKPPVNGVPEATSGGYGITICPGLGQWVLLHPVRETPGFSRGDSPKNTVPVEDVVAFLEAFK